MPRPIGATRALLLAVLLAVPLQATTVRAEDFYAGKQINMIVGSAVGGGYDVYARLLARHWTKFIPGNPTMIVQNMPAAGSLAAMNAIANTAPRDGTTIGMVQNHIGVEPLLGITGPIENMRFDGRTVNWLGSASKEVPIVAAWSNSPIRTFKDVFEQEMLVGSPGAATSGAVVPRMLNEFLGTKFRIITSYKGLTDINLAAERGEVMGRAGWFVSSVLATHAQQLADGRVILLVQLAWEPHPAIPKVPLITEFLKDQEKREMLAFALSWLEMGRPFVAPPGVPADRVKILRDSFMKAIKSPELQAEAKTIGTDIIPMSGEEVQALMVRIYNTPRPIIDRVRAVMLPK